MNVTMWHRLTSYLPVVDTDVETSNCRVRFFDFLFCSTQKFVVGVGLWTAEVEHFWYVALRNYKSMKWCDWKGVPDCNRQLVLNEDALLRNVTKRTAGYWSVKRFAHFSEISRVPVALH